MLHMFRTEPVTEIKDVNILWDLPINTNMTINVNKSDINEKDLKDKTCLLIDMSVLVDLREFEKLSKYKDKWKLKECSNLKTKYIGSCRSTGITQKEECGEFVNSKLGKPNIREVQKIALNSNVCIFSL